VSRADACEGADLFGGALACLSTGESRSLRTLPRQVLSHGLWKLVISLLVLAPGSCVRIIEQVCSVCCVCVCAACCEVRGSSDYRWGKLQVERHSSCLAIRYRVYALPHRDSPTSNRAESNDESERYTNRTRLYDRSQSASHRVDLS
jgi:hypothetical protein